MKQLKSHVRHDDPETMSISHVHVLLLSSAISLIEFTCVAVVISLFGPWLNGARSEVKGDEDEVSIAPQEQASTSCWGNIKLSVLLSQPGESPTSFQLGGSDRNFSQGGRFCQAKKKREGEIKKSPWSAAHGGRRKKIFKENCRSAGKILN